jgi:hypothetical protein
MAAEKYFPGDPIPRDCPRGVGFPPELLCELCSSEGARAHGDMDTLQLLCAACAAVVNG